MVGENGSPLAFGFGKSGSGGDSEFVAGLACSFLRLGIEGGGASLKKTNQGRFGGGQVA